MNYKGRKTISTHQLIQSSASLPSSKSQQGKRILSPPQERQEAKSKRIELSKLSTTGHAAKKPRNSTISSDAQVQATQGVCISTSKNKVQITRPLGEVRSQPINDQSRYNFPPHLDPAYYKKFPKSRTSNSAKEVTPTSIEPLMAGTSEVRAEKQCINDNVFEQPTKSAHNRRPISSSMDGQYADNSQQSTADMTTFSQMDFTLKAPLGGNRSSLPELYDDIEENLDEMEDYVQENMDNLADQVQEEIELNAVKKSKSSRSRNMNVKSILPDRNGLSNYDDKEDVLIIDAENNQKILSGTIQPSDIEGLDDGFRCIVHFTDLIQPVRRGGSVLTAYLGWLAKEETFCPIGLPTWHHVNDHIKIDIVNRVRDKFVIPDGKSYDKAILMRVSKSWKQHKCDLKKKYFDLEERTKEQICNKIPDGITRFNWASLVGYWYSKKGQQLSRIGKEARKSKTHVHTSGATSYANKRVDFHESTGYEPSHIEFFEITHKKSEGGFVENTPSAKFVEEAKSKVEEVIGNSSPSKSRTEVENEVFDEIMYGGVNPKRPIGYGYGVRKSQVSGVHGLLRKGEYKSASTLDNSAQLQARMSGLEKQNQELRSLLLQTLQAVRDGKSTDDAFQGIQSTLSKP